MGYPSRTLRHKGKTGALLVNAVCNNNFAVILNKYSRIIEQRSNGFPVYFIGHEQIGLWFITSHFAPRPQLPIQGSIHFWLLQASFNGQSELIVHSGRHNGGVPKKPLIHEQTPCWLITLHWLLGPHGLGLHGFTGAAEIVKMEV